MALVVVLVSRRSYFDEAVHLPQAADLRLRLPDSESTNQIGARGVCDRLRHRSKVYAMLVFGILDRMIQKRFNFPPGCLRSLVTRSAYVDEVPTEFRKKKKFFQQAWNLLILFCKDCRERERRRDKKCLFSSLQYVKHFFSQYYHPKY